MRAAKNALHFRRIAGSGTSTRALYLSAAALVSSIVLGACGSGDGPGSEAPTVFAATSLTEVFREIEPDARYNFAGSDELATQLREGARADVYAAASPRYPDELFREGLLEEPRIFATNRLVLIVPNGNPAGIGSVADLAKAGVKLVVGAEGVPVGDYTRAVLANMGESNALASVVSEEDDVKGVVGKVSRAEADAGFVYATDVSAAEGEVRAIELPAEAQAKVEYPIAIVNEAGNRELAERFVEHVLGERGRRALERAGFGLP
jgi:molybdate transport system substrate-binding protein